MSTKKDRLNEVYEHLRKYFDVHTKKDFADALRIKQPGLYSAMNGNEAYLTDNLFKRVCAAYQGVFNLDYLLTGEGTLLSEENKTQHPAPPDMSSMINAIIAGKDESIAAKDSTIEILRERIEDYQGQISDLKQLIREKQNTIDFLQNEIKALQEKSDYHNFSYPIGVSDTHPRHKSEK